MSSIETNETTTSVDATTKIEYDQMTSEQEIILLVYMIIVSVFGAISNLLVMLVYFKKRTQYASLYLLFTLALVDFSTSAIVVPMTLATYFETFTTTNLSCQFAYFFRYLTSSLSVCVLGLIAVERYHTISSRTLTSLKNIQLTLVRNSRIAILIMLFICLAYSSGCFFIFEVKYRYLACGEKSESYSLIYNTTGVAGLLLVLLAVIVLYIKTYIVVRKKINKVYNTQYGGDNFVTQINSTTNAKNYIAMSNNRAASNKFNVTSNNSNTVVTKKSISFDTTQNVFKEYTKANSVINDDCKVNNVLSTIEHMNSILRANEPVVGTCTTGTTSLMTTTIKTSLNEMSYKNKSQSTDVNLDCQKSKPLHDETIFEANETTLNAGLSDDATTNNDGFDQLEEYISKSNFDTYSEFNSEIPSKVVSNRQRMPMVILEQNTKVDSLSSKLTAFYSKFLKSVPNNNEIKLFTINVAPKNSISLNGTSSNVIKTSYGLTRNRSLTVTGNIVPKSIFKSSNECQQTNATIRKDWRVARMFILVINNLRKNFI